VSDIFENIEPMVYKSRINVPYQWWAGETASRFFISLRDDQKILGTKCTQCGKTYVPPRKTCPTCFTQNEEWIEVSPIGTLVTYTVVRRQLASLPKKPPIIYGLIHLEGSDTSLLHIIDEVKPEEVKVGMKLQAKFASERKGNIFDIEYFRPVK
jgi:uncharacterized protein